MKLTSIQLENVKRCKAVCFEPNQNGLTVLGGKNGQGKTSVLDAISYALGGEKFRPSNLKRDDAIGDPIIHIETDDGLVIERKGKNSSLTVTDSTGRRAGQTLLDSLVGKFAIDLPKFMNATPKQKADQLLAIIGVSDELMKLDSDYKAKENTRLLVGREAEQKEKAAADLPFYEDAPEEKVSVSDLIKKQQAILAQNGIKEEHKRNLEANERELTSVLDQIATLQKRQLELVDRIDLAKREDFTTESTEELERQIADYESINAKVEANAARAERIAEASDLAEHYKQLTAELHDIKKRRVSLLQNADLPFEGLSVSMDGELLLNGKSWDCMSGSQQLIVATAIASRINPKCGFVLLDKLEQLDVDTLNEFGKWLEENNLQAICTRVSTGKECSLIIEDGIVTESNLQTTKKEEEEY